MPALLDPVPLFKPEAKREPSSRGRQPTAIVPSQIVTVAGARKNEENLKMISVHPQSCGFWLSTQHLNQISDVTDWFSLS